MKKTLLLILWLGYSTTNGFAFDLIFEADPMPFLFNGSSKAVAIKPNSEGHWALWMAEFDMELPEEMINLEKKNKDQGFSHVITPSKGLSLDYLLNPDLDGLYFGAGHFIINNEVSLGDETQTFEITYNFVRVGYYWQISKSFLFHLWLSAGPQSITEGTNLFDGATYEVAGTRILGGPHFSYKF
ncbi:MAG: hypothetical protein QNL04_08995 [SAR324 cluster bacterium]|nr:hypothetical protein [SAR324 cluster bacterium]